MSDDIGDVQRDVDSSLQHLHLHLHVAQDAQVPVNERLQLHQVVQGPERSRETYVGFFLKWYKGAEKSEGVGGGGGWKCSGCGSGSSSRAPKPPSSTVETPPCAGCPAHVRLQERGTERTHQTIWRLVLV